MKVYEEVLAYLQRAGVRHFAGMVGSTTAPYVSTLAEASGVHYVPVRHEQVAAAIVDATARLTGRPGCLLTHGASGALAASLGAAAAAMDSTPMLWLSATQERAAMERGYWQTQDVLTPARGYAKWQARIERPDRAVEAVRRALRESVSGRPGLAQVDLPIDVSVADYDGAPAGEPEDVRAPLVRSAPAPAAVARTRELLAGAQQPVLLVGGGAVYADAGAELLRLAERLGMPVVTSPTSRGVVPEDHVLVLGASGILGYDPIGDAIREADLVLAIGSRLSDLQLARDQLLPSGVPIVQANISPEALGQDHDLALGVAADARLFAEALNAELDREPLDVPAARRDWTRRLDERYRDWREAWFDNAGTEGRIHPAEVVRAMHELLPTRTILTHGAGDHGFYGYMVPVADPGAHLVSARLGAMGCALGYAMGARLARPDQPVVACVGDGELMLQIGDLETMVREGLHAVVVVFNNFRLGSQRKRVEAYGAVTGVDHTNPDFARLAELFGAAGRRVERPGEFADVLKDALGSQGPTVIDVLVDPDARPPRIALSREAR